MVHRVTKSQTRLSNLEHRHALYVRGQNLKSKETMEMTKLIFCYLKTQYIPHLVFGSNLVDSIRNLRFY